MNWKPPEACVTRGSCVLHGSCQSCIAPCKEDPPSSVVRPLLAGEVSPGVVNHTTRFDNAILEAVSAAKSAGIPQGFIVALLHAHAARETSQLLG